MKAQKAFGIALVAILALLLAGCSGVSPEKVQATVEAAIAQHDAQLDSSSQTGTGGQVAAECPQARDLGPWAPNNGVGEDFEVTANETVSAGVHVQLWWPAGSGQAWGKQEISVFLPPGLSIEVLAGAGKGWEYALTCSMEEIQSQMDADHLRRATDTSYYGVVDVDELIDTGLAVVRFDRR